MSMTYKTFNDNDLDQYLGRTNEDLAKICRRDQLARMELARRNHGLDGDIYFISPGSFINDAYGHKEQFPDSTAATIEEMAQEYITFMEAQQTPTE